MEASKTLILVALYMFVVILQVRSSQNLNICSKCTSEPKRDSKVVIFCDSDPSYHMVGRCCVNTSNLVVFGLDLSGCGIKELQRKMFDEYSSMEILMLEDNDITSFEKIDFFGLKSLKELSIPNINDSCPGGPEVWHDIINFSDYVQCVNQTSACKLYNLTCPSNSHCCAAGPGYAECLCEPGYHGYKCKRDGEFPMVIYATSAGCGVIFFSIILWFTERKNAKTTP
ncbi:all-trans retinoic acid-induced differentiation factor-like [Argonauta hians]